MKPCPTPEELERFLEGDLQGEGAEAVSAHVGGCAACQQALERLTSGPALSRVTVTAGGGASRTTFLERLKSRPPGTWAGGRRPGLGGKSPPPVLPGYETLRELGRGGIGVVYLARQESLNRLVALKVLRSGPHANAQERERFRHEAEAVARLQHPNIVHVYEVGEFQGSPYLALEYVEGGSLGDRLRGDPQPLAPAVALVETVARAIHTAHQAGIIHRDLKPANILLRPRGPETDLAECFPKITDFGLAKRLDDPSLRTASGDIVGTPSYMAPEQAAGGRGEVGPATDVYALGAILYELITGRPPFKGATAVDTVVQLLHQEPVRPGSLRPDLPADLETICLQCLNKEPARRYQSAAELAADLARYRKGQPIMARPVGPVERALKWARRHPLPAALVAGIVLVALVGFAAVSWQWRTAVEARDRLAEEKREKEQERQQAERARAEAAVQRAQARAALYGSRIIQSQLSWRVNDLLGARRALRSCRPAEGEEDRRGWEWHYLRRLYRSDLFTVEHRPGGGVGGAVVHSPDGEVVASIVAGPDEGGDGELRVWGARDGELRLHKAVPAPLHRLAYSPDGKSLALAGTDGNVLVLDAASGAEKLKWKAHKQDVSEIVYSPDGTKIATASWDRTARLWGAADGKPGPEFVGHEKRIQAVCFHPQGTSLATASWDKTVRIWPAAGGQAKVLEGHQSPVFGVAFSPDGKHLASGAMNGNVRTWYVEGARQRQSVAALSGAVLCLAFSPDGRYLAYGGSDATARVWDFESGTQEANFRGHTGPVEGLSFSPDGQVLVSGCPREGKVSAWDLTRNPETGQFARTGADVEALAFSRAGRILMTLDKNGRLQRWGRTTGLLRSDRALLPQAPGQAAVGAFAPGAMLVAVGPARGPGAVLVCAAETGKRQAEFLFEGRLACLAFSPGGGLLAAAVTGPSGPYLSVRDSATGKERKRVPLPERPFAVVFRDEDWLAWGGEAGAAAVLHWASGREARLPAHHGSVLALAFSPDGGLVASAGQEDHAVRLSRLSTPGGEAPTLEALEGLGAPTGVCALAFSPDGGRLAGATRDLVRLWDHGARLEMLTLRGPPQRYWDGPFSPRLAFSPGGSALAGSNWDESVSLWEAEGKGGLSEALRQQARRLAEQRAAFWHLQEAEQCLRFRNLDAARFHARRLQGTPLSPPLEARRRALEEALARPENKPGK